MADIHGSESNFEIKCIANSWYYYDYLKNLPTNYRLDEFIYVSQVLGKISFNFTTPANTMNQ